MARVNINESVAASADDVWRVLSDFGGIEPNEMIAGCTVEGDGVGAVRTIALKSGGEVVERLESQDDDARIFSYAIINDSPLPVKNYVATVAIVDDGPGSARVDWTGNFEPSGAPEDEVVKLIQGVYRAGVQRARNKLGI